MKPRAYYNDIDPKVCAWLAELMADGVIPNGDIDKRSIVDVQPEDLAGYTACHWFAGVGGWPYALRLAEWDDARPVWTGSCPCPPFSCAGRKKRCPSCTSDVLVPHVFRTGYFACCSCGHEWFADGRHLWPEFSRLIKACKPECVMGEQVAGADGRVWLAGVRADMETSGHGFRATNLCAGGIGSPHRRQRLFWMAYAEGATRMRPERRDNEGADAGGGGEAGGVAHAERNAREPRRATEQPGSGVEAPGTGPHAEPRRCGLFGWVGDADSGRCAEGEAVSRRPTASPGLSGPWNDFVLIPGPKGKAWRIKPGLEPLVTGLPLGVVPSGDPSPQEAQNTAEARVMRLRGYGNSIVPPLAAEFIRASMLRREGNE